MALIPPGMDFVSELQNLRRVYVTATPRQRLRIIRQRLEDHHFGPNRLVTSVSAVEALARTLTLRRGRPSKADIEARYKQVRRTNPDVLVEQYLAAHGIADPARFFDEDNWQLFLWAVKYRNLVVHECTYLGLDKFPALIEACEAVLERLVEFAKVPDRNDGYW
ncbi:hypothetical protein M6I34_02635 [Burkholderiaceae bacterium FT117]|uniref:hypothetical protein n=1 Tax=Zeimonas sediminis TaxID=2944268 RepID=UPI002343200A|nr:hypothetical protein [Zeimonas sediminis]MCM5569394.1 hypothetical protein [Zeimonas sediminis]